ncbi:MAG TPA: DedA family protein [Longimicrobiaceae bacterium]
MTGWLEGLLDWLTTAPAAIIYLVLGVAATLENIVPPIPADVVVLFGGLLAGRGAANPWVVFVAVWISNVFGALLVYYAGVRFGPGFFSGRVGRMILHPDQLERLGAFYRRFGFGVIFVSRFLPMFRAVVPVFAGVSRLGFWRTAPPLAAASALWYGALVYIGAAAGRNWEEVMAALSSIGVWFWGIAAVAAAGVFWWWWRSR